MRAAFLPCEYAYDFSSNEIANESDFRAVVMIYIAKVCGQRENDSLAM